MNALPFAQSNKSLLVLLAGVVASMLTQTTVAQGSNTELIEQIAKLEVYIKEAETGYQEMQKGLNTIGDIKKGDLDLHTVFFNALGLVSPAVKNYVKVADIMAMQGQMLVKYGSYYGQFSKAGFFSTSDLSYLKAVYTNVMNHNGEDMDELLCILTDGTWQMNDAQRIAQIDKLYIHVSAQYQFIDTFSQQVQGMLARQKNELTSIQNLLKLY